MKLGKPVGKPPVGPATECQCFARYDCVQMERLTAAREAREAGGKTTWKASWKASWDYRLVRKSS